MARPLTTIVHRLVSYLFFLSLFLIFSRFLRLAGRRGSSTVQGTKNAGRGAAATSQSHTHVILHDTEN